MSIKITCGCGKVLKSHDADAGLTGICPYCGRKLHVPGDPPIMESGASTPEVHGGPISVKSVKKVESFMFRQQRRLWILAFLAIPAMAYWLHVWSQQRYKPRPIDKSKPPIEVSDFTERVAKMEDIRRQIVVPPDVPPKSNIRILDGNIQYDLTKFPQGEYWKFNVSAFGPRVGTLYHMKKDLDATFYDVEVRWNVTFESMIGSNLFFRESEEFLTTTPAIDVCATMHPSERSKFSQLRPGDEITIRGRIGNAVIARTDTHPKGVIRIGPRHCIIEK
jgi:hypothetical protein